MAEFTTVGMMVVDTRIGPLTELGRSGPEYMMGLRELGNVIQEAFEVSHGVFSWSFLLGCKA